MPDNRFTPRETPEMCCNCKHWWPYPVDHENGTCHQADQRRIYPAYKGITLWSDGCKHWESNRSEAA